MAGDEAAYADLTVMSPPNNDWALCVIQSDKPIPDLAVTDEALAQKITLHTEYKWSLHYFSRCSGVRIGFFRYPAQPRPLWCGCAVWRHWKR